MVEQNAHLALSITDYAYGLSEGKVTLQGLPDELAQDAEVQEADLGV